MAMQGCMAIAWLGVVGIDTTQTSDIAFQPFENSWVIAPQERQHLSSMQSIAMMPVAGNPVMATRWAAVFREMTDLTVVSPSDATRYGISHHRPIGPTQQMSMEPQVDCILIGTVSGHTPQKGFAGLKELSAQRLYLHLMSDSGTLLWKTELPYTIVTGAKDLDEETVTKTLLTHVKAHANELGLAGLGVISKWTVSRSLSDTSND
jgi:hypothetical protein